ncbi:hypothetical protein DSM106972_023890 [Dulcicalothrix desertica PCC 7102]|uniref:Uncharacterized protein n=1 Tax=Dulcicalothrix desertica PCC 7102 TaxID=232991 RepID=A0A433VLW1_9CYAN|nr:hypothetical protein [Dulcicalothrix desertica]RUT07128.1 hypothetical protein DSM106972_023890 [Dulcicalothrix desertica PCC 7102]TWH61875.1 hypothetical protein CAL7102_00553 [Dulcicalothrix desertica PCC 7102]
MKVTARNPEILKSVKLENLRNYLLDSGWYEDRPFLENATIWLKQEPNNGEFEILLPLRQDVGDYAIRVGEAVKTLAEVENRTPIGILGVALDNVSYTSNSGISFSLFRRRVMKTVEK